MKMKTWQHYVGWLGGVSVLIWAIVVRVYQLASPSYWLDEGYSLTLASAIAQHGYPLLDSGALIWRSPLYHYVLAGMVAAVGTGEFATRLLSVIIGIVTIFILSYAAKRWFGWWAAAFTFVLTAFSTWEIVWSRQARMYMLLQALFWLTVILFEKWWNKRQNKTGQRRFVFFLVLLAIIATLLTHQFGIFVIVVLAAYALTQRSLKRPMHLLLYSLGLVFILVAITLLVRYGLHQPVPMNYWSHYIQFLWRDHAVLMVLAALGVVFSAKQHTALTFWLATMGLLGLGIFSFSITLLHYRYLFFFYPILIWLAAYALSRIVEWWRQRGPAATMLGCAVTLGGLAALLLSHNEIHLLPQAFWELESDPKNSRFAYKSFTPQPDFRAAYAVIAQQLPATVITPYPELSRLYLQRDDDYALYLDVIGSAGKPTTARQVYTGVSYITFTELEHARDSNALILLDYFAERRIPPVLREYIQAHARPIFVSHQGDWSSVTVYQF